MTQRFERDPLKRLKAYLSKVENLPRNWEQTVLGFEQLNHNRQVNRNMKNALIKDTKFRLLNKFLKQNTLPKNWENYVRVQFQNVNKNKLNNAILERKRKNTPLQPVTTYVPKLQNYILRTLRRENNQPPYINIGNRRVHLTKTNVLSMQPSAKNILFRQNINTYRKLITEARARHAQLHPLTLTALVRNRNKYRSYLGQNNTERRNLSDRLQMNKNYLNRLAMSKRLYLPSEPIYKRIVSDIFASVYKLVHNYKNKFTNRGFIYPPLYFSARFPGVVPHVYRMYDLVNIVYREIETIDELEGSIEHFKRVFMSTPVLHCSLARRQLIWRTIERCKGSMASCINECNEIYYGRLKNRNPRKSIF